MIRTMLSSSEVQTLATHAQQLVALTQTAHPVSFGAVIAWIVQLTLSLGLLRPALKDTARLRRRLAALVTSRASRARRKIAR